VQVLYNTAGCVTLNMNIFGLFYMYGCLNTTAANNYDHVMFLIHACYIWSHLLSFPVIDISSFGLRINGRWCVYYSEMWKHLRTA